MVLELAPFVGVEVVHQGYQAGLLEAVIAEQVTDMAPVFLLDMGVVVLLVGA